jgi:hypothetical protein
VGANLFQSGLTRWCLMGTILRKLGVPESRVPRMQAVGVKAY